MTLLWLGLALFFAVHLSAPVIRRATTRNVARLAVALPSFIGLALMVVGYQGAEIQEVYQPLARETALGLSHGVMPIAFVLLVAANTPNNIKRFIPHPMSTAVLIWALLHLAGNGDLASVALFGAFALYALLNIATGARPERAPAPIKWDAITLVIGLVAYGAALWAHGAVGGVYLIG